jgi:hypothetical protein
MSELATWVFKDPVVWKLVSARWIPTRCAHLSLREGSNILRESADVGRLRENLQRATPEAGVPLEQINVLLRSERDPPRVGVEFHGVRDAVRECCYRALRFRETFRVNGTGGAVCRPGEMVVGEEILRIPGTIVRIDKIQLRHFELAWSVLKTRGNPGRDAAASAVEMVLHSNVANGIVDDCSTRVAWISIHEKAFEDGFDCRSRPARWDHASSVCVGRRHRSVRVCHAWDGTAPNRHLSKAAASANAALIVGALSGFGVRLSIPSGRHFGRDGRLLEPESILRLPILGDHGGGRVEDAWKSIVRAQTRGRESALEAWLRLRRFLLWPSPKTPSPFEYRTYVRAWMSAALARRGWVVAESRPRSFGLGRCTRDGAIHLAEYVSQHIEPIEGRPCRRRRHSTARRRAVEQLESRLVEALRRASTPGRMRRSELLRRYNAQQWCATDPSVVAWRGGSAPSSTLGTRRCNPGIERLDVRIIPHGTEVRIRIGDMFGPIRHLGWHMVAIHTKHLKRGVLVSATLPVSRHPSSNDWTCRVAAMEWVLEGLEFHDGGESAIEPVGPVFVRGGYGGFGIPGFVGEWP